MACTLRIAQSWLRKREGKCDMASAFCFASRFTVGHGHPRQRTTPVWIAAQPARSFGHTHRCAMPCRSSPSMRWRRRLPRKHSSCPKARSSCRCALPRRSAPSTPRRRASAFASVLLLYSLRQSARSTGPLHACALRGLKGTHSSGCSQVPLSKHFSRRWLHSRNAAESPVCVCVRVCACVRVRVQVRVCACVRVRARARACLSNIRPHLLEENLQEECVGIAAEPALRPD